MGVKRIPLTTEQFNGLSTLSDWSVEEVPSEHWGKIPGIQRRAEVVAIMASGDALSPQVLNDVSSIVGMDVLVHEPNPKPDEPDGNAYHYVFAKTNDERYPYLMYGPYTSETRVPHWYDATDLETYWTPVESPGEEDAS